MTCIRRDVYDCIYMHGVGGGQHRCEKCNDMAGVFTKSQW